MPRSRLSVKGSVCGPTVTPGNPPSNRPSSLQCFYGRITREEAELFLHERGKAEGLFLLRESISPMGNYAISVCHGAKVHHYSIEKQVEGSYKIPEGKPFPGPVELIDYYRSHSDGFVTQPTLPCDRLPGQSPVAFRGITYHQLEKALLIEAKKINADIDRALGTMRDQLVKRVAQNLHFDMPWYHGKITRQEAEDRLLKDGHAPGKFLIRQRDEKNTYALTISCADTPRHYFIAQRQDFRLSIEEGPRFDCLMMLVDNYHNKSDGLACKLRQPCCRPGYSSIDYEQYMIHSSSRRDSIAFPSPPSPIGSSPPIRGPLPIPPGVRSLPPVPRAADREVDDFAQNMRNAIGETEDHPDVFLDVNADELESIYGSTKFRKEVTTHKLRPEQIELDTLKLGAGNFGSVMKGICHLGAKDIPVAVKTLKKTDLEPGTQSELIKEAEVMKKMDHHHLVRLIGLCEGDTMMLVLELAPLGPLNKFLPKNKHLPLWNVMELMWQVAQGMEYLEAHSFVHRDLAARNILLVDEHFAKISDFGMSKTLSRENNYYLAQQAGKWPLKWYALECINYWKFDSKSDVWSFGVTLWEAASYGAKPYHKMKGQEMVEFLNQGQRLAKPISCTDDIYEVMLECWRENRNDRPTFKKLVPTMQGLCLGLRNSNI